jgi:hypothetical protein
MSITIRTDVLDATFADAGQATLALAREILEGAGSIDIEVERPSGRSYAVDHDEITPEMIEAARGLRRAAGRLWRLLRPLCHVSC